MSINISRDGVAMVMDDSYMDNHLLHEDDGSFARAERDNILATVVDPLVSNSLRWADLTAAKQNEWTTYRTDLLGVPQQAGFPNTITWPTKP
jgi:hypothetical protein